MSQTASSAYTTQPGEPVRHPSWPNVESSDIFRAMWHRRKFIAVLCVLSLVLAAAVLKVSSPIYRAESQVLIENLATSYDRSQDESSLQQANVDEQELGSQVQIIASRDLGRRIIENLKLSEEPEFDPLRAPLGSLSRIMIALGFKDDPRTQSLEQRAYSQYSKSLRVYAVPASRAIAIRYSSSNPQTAAEVANTLAELYVATTRELQDENTARARGWLTSEIESLRKKLAEAESAVEEFRASHNLIRGTSETLQTQELTELNSQITLAQTAKSELEARSSAIRQMLNQHGAVDVSVPVFDSPVVQQLREQQVAMRRQLGELSATYLADHPRMIAVNRDLAKLDIEIREEAERIAHAAEVQSQTASNRVAALQNQLNELKGEAGGTNQDEVRLRALERDAATIKTVLETYMTRLTDATARQSPTAQPGAARIIEQADIPTSPVFPKTGPVLLLAMAGGLMTGLGLAFMAAVMQVSDNSFVQSPRTVEDDRPGYAEPLNVKLLPALPPAMQKSAGSLRNSASSNMEALAVPRTRQLNVAKARALEMTRVPRGPYALALQSILTWAIDLRQSNQGRRLAIMGVGGQGFDSATIALALGRGLSISGLRTILVDTDFDASPIAAIAGGRRMVGFSELMSGDRAFSAVLANEGITGLHMVQAGLVTIDPLKLTGMLVDTMLEALERTYDFVVVHCAPVSGQTSHIWKACSACLLAAPHDSTEQLGRAKEIVVSGGVQTVKIVQTVESLEDRGNRIASKL